MAIGPRYTTSGRRNALSITPLKENVDEAHTEAWGLPGVVQVRAARVAEDWRSIRARAEGCGALLVAAG